MSHQYTNEDIDFILDEILPVNAKNIFERFLAKLTAKFPADDKDGRVGDHIRRLLWGLAIRAREYSPSVHRLQRTGQWSYTELMILCWAFPGGTMPEESKRAPTIEHVAAILCRSVEDVNATKLAQIDHGIAGFGLTR